MAFGKVRLSQTRAVIPYAGHEKVGYPCKQISIYIYIYIYIYLPLLLFIYWKQTIQYSVRANRTKTIHLNCFKTE